MKCNRHLHTKILLYAQDLDEMKDNVNPHEVADKLIELLDSKVPSDCRPRDFYNEIINFF